MKKNLLLMAFLLAIVGSVTASMTAPSEVDVESGNQFFNNYDGKVLAFEITADRFDSDQLRIDADDFNAELSEGQVTEGVTLKVDGKENSAIYPVRDGGRGDLRLPDYKRNSYSWGESWRSSTPGQEERRQSYEDWAGRNCKDLDGDGSIPYKASEWTTGYLEDYINGQVVCVGEQSNVQAQVADISTDPRVEMTTTFNVNGDRKTLSNSDVGQGESYTFGNGIKINFQGGLDAGYNFPVADDSLIAYNNNIGLRIIEKTKYDSEWSSFKSDAESFEKLGNIDSYYNPDKDASQNWENSYESNAQSKAEQVISEYDQSEFFDHESDISGSRLGDAEVKVTGNRYANYPRFMVYVKADEVGYFIPEATPEITSVSAPQLEEGDSGYIDVSVKNTGSGEGDFSARITSCSDGFTYVDTNRELSVSPGETGSVSLGVSFNSGSYDSQYIEGSCDVEVQNLRDNSEIDSSSVSLTGEQSNECDPGSQSTEINENGNYEIYECGSDGLERSLVTTCGDGERATQKSDGSYECVTPAEEKDGDDSPSDPGNSSPNTGSGGSGESCLIDTEVPGLTGSQEFQALCFQDSLLNKFSFIVVLAGGVVGAGSGYMLGSFVDGERNIQGRNRYARRRSVSRVQRSKRSSLSREEVAGGLIGFLVGAGIGFYLGVWGALGFIGLLLLLKYLIPGY